MKNLTGKGKPFHSALDKAAALLKRKVGTGAEFMQELKGLGGIKQAEVDERKLAELMGLPKMTHEQFMAELASRPVPAIGEKVLGQAPERQEVRKEANRMISENARKYASNNADTSGEMRELMADEIRRMRRNHMDDVMNVAETKLDSNNTPYHDKYTLPGGENYREMLIKAPKGGEEFGGVGAHFGGEKNILASMRVKDRVGPNGEKLLHLEELQSDWHQQGREKGYKIQGGELTPKEDNRLTELTMMNPEKMTDAENKELMSLMSRLPLSESETIANKNRVPDAPFKKNWEEMALKRLVHHAAEKGYHGIVVTPGAEQADRYDLSKHIGSIDYSKNPSASGKYYVEAKANNGEVLIGDNLTLDQIEEQVGKEMATKIANGEGKAADQGTNRLAGLDLKVGGEGMKGFYDKKVPNILNAIGKKHGVKTQLHGHNLKISDDLNFPPNNYNLPQHVPGETRAVHHFPITEDMRKDILTNGLPLYKEGGIIRKAEGGNVQPSIAQMRMALMQNKFPSQTALSNIGAEEAPNMPVKAYVPPAGGQDGQLPVGGVDMSDITPGMQYMPEEQQAMQPPGQPGQPASQGPSPLSAGPSAPGQQSNILQMTPQGQAMAAMRPQQDAVKPQMAIGGPVSSLPTMLKQGGTDGNPMDNGATTFSIDDTNLYAKGGNVQGYASKGYVTHTPLKPHPVVGTRFSAVPQGNLVKEKPFNFEDYENKGSIINSPYDATTRDNLVSEISGHNLINPLLTEAGFRYSMDPTHVKQNIGGASNLGIANRQQGRVDQAFQEHGGDVFIMPSTMSDSNAVKDYPENFSHHPTHILLDLMKQRQFNKSILRKLSDDLRSQHELVEDKKTKTKYKIYPYKNFVGFDHPMAEEQLIKGGHGLDTTAGNLRKKMVERLGSVANQKLLDYNIGDLRGAILDPNLASDPKGFMGAVIVKGKPNAPLRRSKHTSYDTDTFGKYAGGFKNRPIEVVQPDVYTTIEKELRSMPKNKGKSEASIRAQVIGAIEKRKENIAQPINSRVINNAGLYEEGLKQGEFDPKNLDSILGYYKRKGGFKKGGKVASGKLSDNLDTMRLALTKKKAK